MNTTRNDQITTVEKRGSLEVSFDVHGTLIHVRLHKVETGHYTLYLIEDNIESILGNITRSGSNRWYSTWGITFRTHQTATVASVLWYLLGRERGIL